MFYVVLPSGWCQLIGCIQIYKCSRKDLANDKRITYFVMQLKIAVFLCLLVGFSLDIGRLE